MMMTDPTISALRYQRRRTPDSGLGLGRYQVSRVPAAWHRRRRRSPRLSLGLRRAR
jgi:hypothetical protein